MEVHEPAVVASGVDALVLSGLVEELPPGLVLKLESARERARQAESPVEMDLGGVPIAMNPGPFGRYRYSLEHENARFGFTTSPKLPALRVQFRARFLHGAGIDVALGWLEAVIGSTGLEPVWSVSRIDLFADLQGWPLTAEDRRVRRTRRQEKDV